MLSLITMDLTEFITGVAVNLAHQEARLARDYQKRLKEFQPVLLLAKSLGYEDIARAVAPRQVSAGRMNVAGQVFVSETRETEFSLNFLSLGFTRKYKHSKFVSHNLRLRVDNLPLPPGNKNAHSK
ncbi:MAG TPA: hypothetical protein VLB46_02865 [Pyrinomonadaceae bacterium]|nr:hypothetical protein [Pyrinomonadaceae bacterium]